MQDHSLACLGTSPPEWFFIQNGSLRMQPHATQLQLRDRSQELAHFPTTLGLARGLLVTNRESLQVRKHHHLLPPLCPPGLPRRGYVPTPSGARLTEAGLWVPHQGDTALIILSSTGKGVRAVPCNEHGLDVPSALHLQAENQGGSHSIPSLLLCLLTNFEFPLTAASASALFPRARAPHKFIW